MSHIDRFVEMLSNKLHIIVGWVLVNINFVGITQDVNGALVKLFETVFLDYLTD